MIARRYRARVLAMALAAGVAAPAIAAHADDPVSKATRSAAGAGQDQSFRISDKGFAAMRDVRAARLALFNGDTRLAGQLVSDAKKKIDAAEKDAITLGDRNFTVAGTGMRVYDEAGRISAVPGRLSAGKGSMSDAAAAAGKAPGTKTGSDAGSAQGSTRFIPIDAEVSLTEAFLTPEMQQQGTGTDNSAAGNAKAAGKPEAAGTPQAAATGMPPAEVDLVTAWALVPADATKQAVARADDLIGQQKWYEADRALQSAEDGIVIGALDVEGVPAGQARSGTGAAHAASGQISGQQASGGAKTSPTK